MTAIADRLEHSQTNPVTKPPSYEQKKRIIEEFINKLDPEADVFYIIATPTGGVTLNNFWDKSENSIHHFMKNPPILRNMGWDLSVWITEYPQTEGNSWEIMNGNRKILKVTKNGIVAGGANIQDFLDWGLRDEEKNEDKKGNMRDYATISQLICLSNLESLNSVFIKEDIPQQKRLIKLNEIAISQMGILVGTDTRKLSKK